MQKRKKDPAPLSEAISKPDQKTSIQQIGILGLFKYASRSQKVAVAFAVGLSVLHGVTWPIFATIFGTVTSDLTPDKSPEEIEKTAGKSALLLFGLAIVTFINSSVSFAILKAVGAKVVENLRNAYFKKILEMDISWFDLHNPEKITSQYTEELSGFSKGCGFSIQTFFSDLAMGLAGVTAGFATAWLYSLYITLTLPIMILGMGAFVLVIMKQSAITKDSYAKAGANAEQALSAIKTVMSLNGEEFEV